MDAATATLVGVILAGGRSRRMGGADKALVPLADRPLIAHVIDRLAPQVNLVIINANSSPDRFAAFGLPVVSDTIAGLAGPLAGILTGLRWTMANRPDARAIVTAAVDTPFLPKDLGHRLVAARDRAGADVAVASSGGRTHPVFGVISVACANSLENQIRSGRSLKVTDWLATRKVVTEDFIVEPGGPDPFFNINTPADLEVAHDMAWRLQPLPR